MSICLAAKKKSASSYITAMWPVQWISALPAFSKTSLFFCLISHQMTNINHTKNTM